MSRVLVIGDLHAPFIRKDYLAHCKKVARKHKVDEIIFIGDIIDAHYSSFHKQDPDGLGGGDELEAAIKQLKPWYKAFPKATVILGNHDRIVKRKAKVADIPSKWVKDYAEVLEVPEWDFLVQTEVDGVLYMHGEGGSAKTMVKHHGCPVVQGHRHSEFYVEYFFSPQGNNFGMQVGCGVDRHSYAMEYARAYKPQAIGCGVVIDGTQAYLEPLVH